MNATAQTLRLSHNSIVVPFFGVPGASWPVVGPTARRWGNNTRAPHSLLERTLRILRSVAQDTPDSSPTDSAGSASAVLTESHPPSQGASVGPDSASIDGLAPPVSMEQLIHDHADAVYRVALSVTRDATLAEDASQDAMIKAWLALPTFRGEAPLRHWVLRIAQNTAVSLLRKRREEVRDPHTLPEKVSRNVVESQVMNRLAIDRFGLALRDLDEISRSIVVLREVEGLTYDEICDVLELPMPTVKTRLLRARRHLATALEGWQP